MNDIEWLNLNQKIKQEFNMDDDSIELEQFPSIIELEELDINKIYSAPFACICVDIVNSKEIYECFSDRDISKMLSQFKFAIDRIMHLYNAQYINLEKDAIYGIFQIKNQIDMNKIIKCCGEINTFRKHLNKLIEKELKINYYLNYGIGASFSKSNDFLIYNLSYDSDILFSSKAINIASRLAKLSNRNNEEETNILIDSSIFQCLSEDVKKIFKKYKILSGQQMYKAKFYSTKYLNWIKNNI